MTPSQKNRVFDQKSKKAGFWGWRAENARIGPVPGRYAFRRPSKRVFRVRFAGNGLLGSFARGLAVVGLVGGEVARGTPKIGQKSAENRPKMRQNLKTYL